ncbi:MAG: dihydropteroate synthase, partial [candidate division WOR-3 bacterium]
IDIGAESTRPGALPVPAAEQKRRLQPVLAGLKGIRVPLSIDTMSAAVAAWALDMGVAMVNDVSGLSADPAMAGVVARAGAACVIMHMKGRPRTMQKNPVYADLMAEITAWLQAAVERAEQAGIAEDRIVVDPGIGFGKTVEHNFTILRRLGELKSLGRPVLVGPSRKSFIGKTLDVGTEERLEGTLAACVLAASNGADILRVHDVKEAVKALCIADRIYGRGS